jgi:hypothetical protein
MPIKQCKHLDYEDNYPDCELKTCEPQFPDVKYWHRNNPPYEGAPIRVQFCKERGYINGIFQCYTIGELSCHEPIMDTTTLNNNHD